MGYVTKLSFFSQRPFLRLALFFMLGIISAHKTSFFSYRQSCAAFGGLVTVYMLVWIWRRCKRIYGGSLFLGMLGLVAVYMGGYVRFLQQDPLYQKKHFAHVLDDVASYRGVVVYHPPYGGEVLVQVEDVFTGGKWQEAVGVVKLKVIPKMFDQLGYGTFLHVSGTPQVMRKPTNPHVVDYGMHWRIQGVFHQHTAKKIKLLGCKSPSWLLYYGSQARKYCVMRLKSLFNDQEALAVGVSLLLGDRSYLGEGVKKKYRETGLMHVLAVSGLHVGLLYMLLLWFFSLLGMLFRRPFSGRFLGILILWLYAWITGFSPSTLRAVGLLSLTTLARWLQRDVPMVNVTGAMGFFLCLYNPYMLFDIGFQLSFCAFLSILLFYKPICSLWQPQHKYVRSWWKMTATSLAVQVGSWPLSIYYFHFFATYFLLANWVVLPWMPGLLGLGIVSLLLIWTTYLGSLFTWCWEKSIKLISWPIGCLAGLPYAYLGPYYISSTMFFLYYAVLGMLYTLLKRRQFKYWVWTALLVCLGSMYHIYEQSCQKLQRRLVVYDVAPHYVTAFVEGSQTYLVGDAVLYEHTWHYVRQILPSLRYWGVQNVAQYTEDRHTRLPCWVEQQHGGGIIWHGKTVVILSGRKGLAVKEALPDKIDVLIVEQDALQDLPDWSSSDVGYLVVGTSNRKGRQLVAEARERGIRCHDVAVEGAFEISW